MYKSMKWNRFRELMFSKDKIGDIELEYISVCNVNNSIINCNISHSISNGLIIFDNNCKKNVFKLFMDLNCICNNINVNENENNTRKCV